MFSWNRLGFKAADKQAVVMYRSVENPLFKAMDSLFVKSLKNQDFAAVLDFYMTPTYKRSEILVAIDSVSFVYQTSVDGAVAEAYWDFLLDLMAADPESFAVFTQSENRMITSNFMAATSFYKDNMQMEEFCEFARSKSFSAFISSRMASAVNKELPFEFRVIANMLDSCR